MECLRVQEPSHFTGSEVRIRDPDLPTLQFAVAFKGASWTDPDSVALMIMQQMLGSWNKASGVADTAASGVLPHLERFSPLDTTSASASALFWIEH